MLNININNLIVLNVVESPGIGPYYDQSCSSQGLRESELSSFGLQDDLPMIGGGSILCTLSAQASTMFNIFNHTRFSILM